MRWAADCLLGPGGVQPDLVDMPVIRRGHDTAVVPRRLAGDGVRLELIQSQRILRPVRLAQPVGEIYYRAGRKSLFQLIRKHPLPLDFAHKTLLE